MKHTYYILSTYKRHDPYCLRTCTRFTPLSSGEYNTYILCMNIQCTYIHRAQGRVPAGEYNTYILCMNIQCTYIHRAQGRVPAIQNLPNSKLTLRWYNAGWFNWLARRNETQSKRLGASSVHPLESPL
jgi:hypothetical protein